MSNDPDLLASDSCDRCEAADGRRIYVGQAGNGHDWDGLCDPCLAELAAEADDEEESAGWTCFMPACSYRSPGMTLADRDVYDAHMREHERQLISARERTDRATRQARAGR